MTRLRLALFGLYPLDGVPTGGAENICYQLASSLEHRDDLEVHVVCPGRREAGDRVIDAGRLRIHVVGMAGWLPPSINQYWRIRRRFVRIIRDVAPDVAHAHAPLYGLWSTEVGIPTVFTIHGIYDKEAPLERGLRRVASFVHMHYFKKALRQAHHIISISPYAEESLRPLTAAEFFHIANAVNPRLFALDSDRAEPGRMLFIGLLSRRKCIVELLETFRQILRDHPEARLHLIGKRSGEAYYREVTDFISRHGLQDAVTLLGAVSQERVFEEFERAAVIVLMSHQETAPGVIAEAMAAGKPVVSNRICGIPYMVDDGVTGLLAEAGDVAGFARQVSRLLEAPELAREMGRRGRQKALREYHPDRIVEATVSVYRHVVDSSHARQPEMEG